MTNRLDIYRSANILVKQHGDEALIEAAMHADAMLERGDLDGRTVWLRILKAVEALLIKERHDGGNLRLPKSRRGRLWDAQRIFFLS